MMKAGIYRNDAGREIEVFHEAIGIREFEVLADSHLWVGERTTTDGRRRDVIVTPASLRTAGYKLVE